jgi:hypothetical protein
LLQAILNNNYRAGCFLSADSKVLKVSPFRSKL